MRYIKKGKERTKEDARALRRAVSEIIEMCGIPSGCQRRRSRLPWRS